MKQLVRQMFEHGGEYESEYRITRPDGSTRWILGHGSVELDECGKPAFARGVSRDITKRKIAEEELRESEERFRTVANAAPVMIWMTGPDRLCTFVNKGWLDFTGRSLEQELGLDGHRAFTSKTWIAPSMFIKIPSTRANRLQWNTACSEVTVNTAGFWIAEHHGLLLMARSSVTLVHA